MQNVTFFGQNRKSELNTDISESLANSSNHFHRLVRACGVVQRTVGENSPGRWDRQRRRMLQCCALRSVRWARHELCTMREALRQAGEPPKKAGTTGGGRGMGGQMGLECPHTCGRFSGAVREWAPCHWLWLWCVRMLQCSGQQIVHQGQRF